MDLVLIHRPKPLVTETPIATLAWETCLRRIDFMDQAVWDELAIGMQDATAEVYQGSAAYKFLLEIICGLHSPMLGETEVLGQFRLFLKNNEDHPLIRREQSLWNALRRDGKLVRELHLMGLGCHSYGSLARKYLKGFQSVTLLGSGHLAQEIVPWLKEIPKIQALSRSEIRLSDLAAIRPDLEKGYLQDPPALFGQAVMICAPLSNERVTELLEGRMPRVVLDFRGEARWSPENNSSQPESVIVLQDLLGSLQSDRLAAEQKRLSAAREIEACARQYEQKIMVRPMGWDDLWA